MKETIQTTRIHAFVVQTADLDKLWRLLAKDDGVVTVSVDCSDDISRQFDDWEELLSYDNPSTKRIKALFITSSRGSRPYASIDFEDQQLLHGMIRIHIEAEDRLDSAIRDGIVDVIEGTKPWYSPFAQATFPFGSVVAICTYVGIWWVLGELSLKFVSLRDASESTMMFFFVALSIVTAFVMTGLNRLRVRAFPACYFALGQGKRRYDADERIRWGVIVALLVSISGAVLVQLIL